MNISLPNLNLRAIPKISNNFKSQPISFKAKADTVEFSTVAKEKSDILHQLAEAGYSSKYASIMMKKYVGTEDYNDLVNGIYDIVDREYYPSHCVGSIIDKNLEPAEAIVYLEESMDYYYMQHEPVSLVPVDCNTNLTLEAKNYDIGKADFTPLELAKQIKKGYPIEVAGMILKGKINEQTADKVLKYYDASSEGGEMVPNVQASECIIEKLAQNLDRMDVWTSEEEDENGKLKSGLTRPLTADEAYAFATCEPFYCFHLDKEYSSATASINEYIADEDEYQKQERKEATKKSNVVRAGTTLCFNNLQDVLDYLIRRQKSIKKTDNSKKIEFLQDLKGLDDRYFKRLPVNTISSDLKYAPIMNMELTERNIEALSRVSDELLDKMTLGKSGKVGHFATLYPLLKTKNLAENIDNIEQFRKDSPKLFEAMTKEMILDCLTGTKFYTDGQKTTEEFWSIYRGKGPLPQEESAEIIPFAPVES